MFPNNKNNAFIPTLCFGEKVHDFFVLTIHLIKVTSSYAAEYNAPHDVNEGNEGMGYVEIIPNHSFKPC